MIVTGAYGQWAEPPPWRVECCMCFQRFEAKDLLTEDGITVNVCQGCAGQA